MTTRHEILSLVADAVESLRLDHPVRVGIDGRSAAGKTTFADALTETLRARGREVIRIELDDFHHPGHKWRSIRDEWTPQSRYDESYDYDAFSLFVLEPLGPGGDRRIRPRLFDSFNDAPYPEEWIRVGEHAIAVIDGAFLLRPELAAHWDYLTWLDIDAEILVRRARGRDIRWVGSADEVERRYRDYGIASHELYESLEHPAERAGIVIDNTDPLAPRVVRA